MKTEHERQEIINDINAILQHAYHCSAVTCVPIWVKSITTD